MSSNFTFLSPTHPLIFETAHKAEKYTHLEPEMALIYARKALEQLVFWQYANDPRLTEHLPAEPKDQTLKTCSSTRLFGKPCLRNCISSLIC
ncbi:hypothetical protein [Tellurirhabdus rosea]|uniref:hypothetical protein n=1 Tax=Tellurirhabdus rosea TaxID=2674997 RepID=UPI002251B99D|nr:hypothetical protein [Tellurirhabdus rosea]